MHCHKQQFRQKALGQVDLSKWRNKCRSVKGNGLFLTQHNGFRFRHRQLLFFRLPNKYISMISVLTRIRSTLNLNFDSASHRLQAPNKGFIQTRSNVFSRQKLTASCRPLILPFYVTAKIGSVECPSFAAISTLLKGHAKMVDNLDLDIYLQFT